MLAYMYYIAYNELVRKEMNRKMKKFDLCVKLVVEDVKADLDGYYKDSDIETWADYLEETGCDSREMKENVLYVLNIYSDENGIDLYFNDSSELELEDGSLLTYRKMMNAVRKELKKENYLK